MQQADDVSSYAREDRPRIHGVRSLMSYSTTYTQQDDDTKREKIIMIYAFFLDQVWQFVLDLLCLSFSVRLVRVSVSVLNLLARSSISFSSLTI